MGADALQGNGITRKILYFFQDKALTPADEPLRKVRKSRILLFVAVQLAGFGATFAVTQTIGKSALALAGALKLTVRSCNWLPCNHIHADTLTDSGHSPISVYCRGVSDTGRAHCVSICEY